MIGRLALAAALVTGCTAAPPPATAVPDVPTRVDTVVVTRQPSADPDLQETVARLQLQLYERDAQIADLQQKLDDAVQEVVRSMARLQSLASRTEAASAIAEAEIAIARLAAMPGATGAPERLEAEGRLRMSNQQFERENYGGAVYLATEARSAARRGAARLAGADTSGRPEESLFAVPVRLVTTTRSNVRIGPGLQFAVEFTVEPDTPLTGHAFMDTWVRVTDAEGRSGWIFHALVTDAGGA